MQLLKQPLAGRPRLLCGVLGVVGLGLAVEVLIRSGLVSAIGVPVPSRLVTDGVRLLQDPQFSAQVLFTLREWMLALLIASVVGVTVGTVMGAFRWGQHLFAIPVEVLRPLPSIAVGPILLLVLGSGLLPLALTVSGACLWPILFNTMYAVRSADPVAMDTARTLHLSTMETLTRVRLPAALPFIFTGIRVSASIGLIVAVSAELLIGSGEGIGGHILVLSTSPDSLSEVYAATAAAAVLGLVVSGVFALLDRTLFGWKKGLAT